MVTTQVQVGDARVIVTQDHSILRDWPSAGLYELEAEIEHHERQRAAELRQMAAFEVEDARPSERPIRKTRAQQADRLAAMSESYSEAYYVTTYRGHQAAFRQERGITTYQEEGRPDRPSQTYEGRRIRSARAAVREGRYPDIETALRQMPRRNRTRA